MKSVRFISGRVAAIVLTAFVLFGATSCVEPESPADDGITPVALSATDSIIGTWSDNDPTWATTFVFATDKVSSGYEGETPYIYKINETSGYVYIKYTKSLDYSDPSYYSVNGADVGKWYAIYYCDMKTQDGTTTAEIAGAYNADGKTSTSTLEEAVKEFTVDNNYFKDSTTCTKL